MFGDRKRIHVTDDAERNASLVQRCDVHRIVADSVARNDLEPRRLGNRRGRQRLGADDQRIGFADEGGVARLGDFLHVVIRESVRRPRAARDLRDAAFPRSTDAASIGSLFGLRADLADQLPELRHARPRRSGEKPRVSRHRRHVEAPLDGARRVIGRSTMERGADAIGLARGDNLLERRDHLGLLAVEARRRRPCARPSVRSAGPT